MEITWHQNKHIHLVQKREKRRNQMRKKHSQDEGKVCFHVVSGGGVLT